MTVASALDVASFALFLIGGGFCLIGAIGTLRFPDFYTRMHAAGVTDTLGADLILLGMLLQAPSWIVAVKLVCVFFFFLLTSPVSTHALAHAAYVSRLVPLIGAGLQPAKTRADWGDDGESVR